jgi:hypothetical protein
MIGFLEVYLANVHLFAVIHSLFPEALYFSFPAFYFSCSAISGYLLFLLFLLIVRFIFHLVLLFLIETFTLLISLFVHRIPFAYLTIQRQQNNIPKKPFQYPFN